MLRWQSLFLATLAALAWLAPLPARALPSGSTHASWSYTGVPYAQDNQTGLGVTSQVANDEWGVQANAFASNSVPFPGTPPALKASARLLLDNPDLDTSYQSWAAAVGTYDWEVLDLDEPWATGTILIQGTTTFSGKLVGDPSVPSSAVSVGFSFSDPVDGGAAQSVWCALSATAGGAECGSTTSGSAAADLSGLSITPLSATEWEIAGLVIFDIEVTVNAVNELGGQLTTSVGVGPGLPSFFAESLFDQTLTLEYASSDPSIQITLIPEPGTVTLLGLGLIGLALFGGRRAAR